MAAESLELTWKQAEMTARRLPGNEVVAQTALRNAESALEESGCYRDGRLGGCANARRRLEDARSEAARALAAEQDGDTVEAERLWYEVRRECQKAVQVLRSAQALEGTS